MSDPGDQPPAWQQQPPQWGPPPQQQQPWQQSPKTSGMAIASLVVSIVGVFCFIGAIVGLVLGIVALNQINKSNGTVTGRGFAIAGIVIGGLAIALFVILLAVGGGSFSYNAG